MSADQQFIYAPPTARVEFAVHQGVGVLNSMMILNQADELSGFGDWVERITGNMPAERRRRNDMVFMVFYGGFEPKETPSTFEDVIAYAEMVDAVAARDAALKMFQHKCEHYQLDIEVSAEQMLADKQVYMDVIRALTEKWQEVKGASYDLTIYDEAYSYLQDPARLKHMVVDHLRTMWEGGLKTEWERNLHVLEASAEAFKQLDLDGMTPIDAIRVVTGRDMSEFWKMETPPRLVFVPSAHIGPYLSYFSEGETTYVVFGARVPEGVQIPSTELGRSELLVRLNALADDTRLQIISLLVKHEEMCAQDIKDVLGLSQSSASRHLRQLTATGYVNERRRDVAKCYTLNMERFDNTLDALRQFIRKA